MFVLGQIKTKESAEGLVKRIKDPSFVDADAAIAALGGYGDLAVPELSTLLKDERTKDRAKDILKDIDPGNESRSLLRAMLDSDDAKERGGAAYVLGYWRDSGSVTKIEKLVFDRDVSVREDALDGYGALYSETPEKYDLDMVAKVINTRDNEFATRKKAISMLRRIPGMRTSEVLLELIKNTKENRILTRLLFAVGRSSDDSMVVPILDILNGNTDPDVKGAAMSALGMLKAEEAVPYIADAIAKGNIVNDSMRYEGFQALTAIGKCVDCRPFLKYLGNDYESGCNDCDGFNDKLLDLIEMCARPGDKDIVNALETYKAKGDRRLAPRAEQILEKLK
jgi:HEAT repeat protein